VKKDKNRGREVGRRAIGAKEGLFWKGERKKKVWE